MTQNRQPRGIPAGGEFAANQHDEAPSILDAEGISREQLLADEASLYAEAAKMSRRDEAMQWLATIVDDAEEDKATFVFERDDRGRLRGSWGGVPMPDTRLPMLIGGQLPEGADRAEAKVTADWDKSSYRVEIGDRSEMIPMMDSNEEMFGELRRRARETDRMSDVAEKTALLRDLSPKVDGSASFDAVVFRDDKGLVANISDGSGTASETRDPMVLGALERLGARGRRARLEVEMDDRGAKITSPDADGGMTVENELVYGEDYPSGWSTP